jgi:hypothetical protein
MQNKNAHFILLSILLFILFTFPFITIFDKKKLVAGIPVLYLYVFVLWMIAIIVFYKMVLNKTQKFDDK